MNENQIIAQEMAKMQKQNDGAEISENELYIKLSEPFKNEALSIDNSRGFALTSIKAQYVIERLNNVLGPMNWTFGGTFREVNDDKGKLTGVVYEGALVINVDGKQNKHFAPGYSSAKKNMGDTYKSAQTDSLCKCASRYGIGNEVYKGLIDAKSIEKKTTSKFQKASKSDSDDEI